jgi:membrane peptidoglycan carboxypeptidase
MGLRQVPDTPIKPDHASFFLGVDAVSPLMMADAYATFAAHGKFCTAHGIARILDGTKVLENVKPDCKQVLTPAVADKVTSVLRGVIDGPNPARTGAGAAIGRPAAGKTGTTNDEQMAWFCGYTPDLATAVWVGDPRGPKYPLHDIKADGQTFPVVFGGDLPATIWRKTMTGAEAGHPVRDFPVPIAIPVAPAPSPSPTPSVTPSPSSSSSPTPQPSTTTTPKPTTPPPPKPTKSTKPPKPTKKPPKPTPPGRH